MAHSTGSPLSCFPKAVHCHDFRLDSGSAESILCLSVAFKRKPALIRRLQHDFFFNILAFLTTHIKINIFF